MKAQPQRRERGPHAPRQLVVEPRQQDIAHTFFNHHTHKYPNNGQLITPGPLDALFVCVEAKMLKILGMKPTWAADHIKGDGVKTWVDVATSTGFEEPVEEEAAK